MIDPDRILRETFVRDLEVHEDLTSTNDHALRSAPYLKSTPHLVIARRQQRGRGRGTNEWWSSEGALTFSLIVDVDSNRVPASRWPQFSLATGAGVCAAIEGLLPAAEARLKWPNDVYLNGRKVCGVLVEVPSSVPGRLVIGVGLNVNNPLAEGPAEIQERATALIDVQRSEFEMTDVLSVVLRGIADEYAGIERSDSARGRGWRKRSLLTGRIVTLDDGARTVTGTCLGIEDDGALLLETPAGPQPFYGGVITDFS